MHGVSLAVMAAAVLAACGGGGGGGGDTTTVETPTSVNTGGGAGTVSPPVTTPTTPTTPAGGTVTPTTPTTTPATPTTTPTASGTTIAGTVAYGAPLAGAQVQVMDANGTVRSTSADAAGRYSLNVGGLSAPLLVTASGRSGDAALTYRALLAAAPGAGAVVNVTPLTDAIVALASSAGNNPAEFDNATTLRALNAARLQQAAQAVKTAIAPVAQAVGAASLDPQSGAFAADRASAGDKLLDAVKVSLSEGGVTLRNALVPLASADTGAAAASVTLASADATPASLPAPVLTDNLTMFDAFMAEANACLALAPEQRVAADMVGTPTGFQGACATVNGFAANYKHNGQTLLQHWGHQLRNVIPAGARMGLPEVLGLVNDTNGDTLALVRLPVTSAAGSMSFVETARRLPGGQWAIEGNQRKYDAGVSVRMLRSVDASTHGFVPTSGPDAGKNVGRLSHQAARLHFHFNQSGPNGKNVYAVRVKGPGLPAAGVVLARSSSCGTHNQLAFYSNNGTPPAAPAVGAKMPMPTSATGNHWTLRLAPWGNGYAGSDFFNELRGRDASGTASTSAQNSVAAVPVDLAKVPLLARYVFEVFTAGSASPTDSFAVRSVARPLAPEFAERLAWAELSAEARGWADPANANQAAAQTQARLSWTLPSGAAPVTGGGLWGRGFDSGATPILRQTVANASVAAFGATSLTLNFRDPAGLEVISRNGNGDSCGFDQLPAFEATKGAREVSLRQAQADGLVLHQVLVHQGRAATN